MMQIVENNVTETEWKHFLDSCPSSTIYHTPEWKRFLTDTFHYEPHYLFAINECQEIFGLLPIFQINSPLTGNRLVSLPFAHDCKPLSDPDVAMKLIAATVDLHKHLKTRSIELRTGIDHSSFISQNLFSTYILQLSTVEKTWDLIHKSAKRYIKKSLESVSVTRSNFEEDAEIFYQINCKNKKNKGVPAHPEKFFKNLIAIFPDFVDIYLAKLGSDTIGGIITLSYGTDSVIYGYGASDPNYLGYSPLYPCLWRSIEDSCQLGRKNYDFGRVSYENTGLIEFKKKWGAQERKLYYSCHPVSSRSVMNDRDSSLYRLGNSIIRVMPMSAYKIISDSIFSSFG